MRNVHIITVPYDSGRREFRMGAGPGHLVRNGLDSFLRGRGWAGTNETVETTDNQDALQSAAELGGCIARAVADAQSTGSIPIVLAGNCISTVGALAGLRDAPGVAWFDAHGDLNTPETSTTGFIDGMAAATALGWCLPEITAALPSFTPLDPSHLVLVGTRDLDPAEQVAADSKRIRRIHTDDVKAGDLHDIEALADDVKDVWLHLDLDALDPHDVGRANSFAVERGLTTEDAVNVIDAIAGRARIVGATISAYDPTADSDGAVARAAFALIAAALEGSHDG